MGDITVTVNDDHLSEIDAVAAALRDKGMTIHEVLGAMGVIIGSAPDDRRNSLAAVGGVKAIEDDLAFRLPPPESEIQ
jgi:hypothetical protein